MKRSQIVQLSFWPSAAATFTQWAFKLGIYLLFFYFLTGVVIAAFVQQGALQYHNDINGEMSEEVQVFSCI